MSKVVCPEPGSQLTIGSVTFAPAPVYVPVLDRQHWPTAETEMHRLRDECAKLEKENHDMRAALTELAKYFTTGNSVAVERATITAADFWRIAGMVFNVQAEGRAAVGPSRSSAELGVLPTENKP